MSVQTQGTIYIVAPNQAPTWIDTAHPRLKMIDQDDLFPDEDRDTLPTFNTNVRASHAASCTATVVETDTQTHTRSVFIDTRIRARVCACMRSRACATASYTASCTAS